MVRKYEFVDTVDGGEIVLTKIIGNGDVVFTIDVRGDGCMTADQCLELEQKLKAIREAKQ